MKRWEMTGKGVSNLHFKDVDKPVIKDNEVMVKVAAVALNFRDLLNIESGTNLSDDTPFTPASDLAGEVVAIGKSVTRFSPGDKVISSFAPDWLDGPAPGKANLTHYRDALGGSKPGVLSEFVSFPEDWFVRAPAHLSPEEASTLTCAGMTAWYALVEKGKISSGETVLIEGTGGVALFALQISKALGAKVIITSGSDEKLHKARELGADITLNRHNKEWVQQLMSATNDIGVDHVLELVGGEHLNQAVQAASMNGKIYQVGVLQGFDLKIPAGALMLKNLTLYGIGVGPRKSLENLVKMTENYSIRPVIDKCFPASSLKEALRRMKEGPFGKVIVTF